MYFKNELKYSKGSNHMTDDVMSIVFGNEKNLSGRTLLSLPCETSTLYSPRPSFPTFFAHVHCPLKF